MRQALRVTTVFVIGILEVACFTVALVTWNTPGAEFGWNLGRDALTVTSVEPNLPAARAGIVPGDKIVYATMPVLGRIDALLAESVYPGATISFRVVHDGIERQVTMQAESFPSISAPANVAYAFGGLALGLVGLALVAFRPSAMTWGFAAVAPTLIFPEALYIWSERAPLEQAFAFHILLSILYALQLLGVIVFACRFPTDSPAGFAKTVSHVAAPISAAALAVYWYIDYAVFISNVAPPHWTLLLNDYAATILGAILALVAMFSNYAAQQRINRSRLVPVIAAFVVLNVSIAVEQIVSEVSSNPAGVGATYFFFAVSAALLATAIAYGVVRHRVIDVNFIISRTLVYTILTVFVVAVFSLIEYVFGKLLEHQGVATFLEIAAAVGLGLSLNVLHGRLDNFIDRTIFRKRHLAETRLERASETLPHATSSDFVHEMLVAEPVDALQLASAAVFRRNGTGFRRESAAGWSPGDAAELEENDHLVARLRAELQPLSISEVRWPRENVPGGVAAPLYAVPIASGHSLAAFALYGGHAGGEDLDPDERRSLRALAAGAALAYDHLTAEELKRTIDELRGENEALRRSQELLVDKVLKRLE
ncbi:MAG TPA: hypothetical protein VGG89_08915 [Candidatus Baltobacteraceae bacterium]